MKSIITLLFITLLATSCYNPSAKEAFNDIAKLQGNWQSYKGVKFNENWRIVNQRLLAGEGFSLNSTDTVFYESLTIEQIGDSLYYKVSTNEHDEDVAFLLTNATKNKWKFENPNNSYPSIINYHLINDTTLTITLSNIRGNKEQFFYLVKIN